MNTSTTVSAMLKHLMDLANKMMRLILFPIRVPLQFILTDKFGVSNAYSMLSLPGH